MSTSCRIQDNGHCRTAPVLGHPRETAVPILRLASSLEPASAESRAGGSLTDQLESLREKARKDRSSGDQEPIYGREHFLFLESERLN